MKNFLFILILFALIPSVTMAQTIEITGKVINKKTQEPIEFATIMLFDSDTRQFIAGHTSQSDGSVRFSVKGAKFYSEISFIGFIKKKIEALEAVDNKIDLGTIELEENSIDMDEVVVQGERSTVEFKLDKRVFNVGQELSNSGASALEVLNNIPSVSVSIDGQIMLRGVTGVQILINGKPSVMTSDGGNALGTLTADMIERVEVITNPSAKYDAEGTTGILNIVLKKDEKKGINGSLSVSTGAPNNHLLGLNFNRRTQKFNFFSQFGVGYRTMPEKFREVFGDLVSQTEVKSIGYWEKNEEFINVTIGADYHFNEKHVLTLSTYYAYEGETEESEGNFSVERPNGLVVKSWLRDQSTTASNPKQQYELNYKGSFSEKGDHNLLLSAVGSSFAKDQSSIFGNNPLTGLDAPDNQQSTINNFSQNEYALKADYERPLSEKIKLEAGAQYLVNKVFNDFSISNMESGKWQVIPQLTNTFFYRQDVFGLYSTGSYEGKKIGIKGGLRLENTDLETLLEQTDQRNEQDFLNLFPTFHASYKFNNDFSIQGGYSRRIFRPRFWHLNPFTDIRNNFSVWSGNPDLLPELTDSYEITGIWNLSILSINASIYRRFVTQTIENVTRFENGISQTRPTNIGTNSATGIEFNAKINPLEWWSINTDFNLNYFKRNGIFENQEFSFSANQWSSRLTNRLKLPADLTIEIVGDFRSSYRTFQREISGFAAANLAMRKKIMKGKAVVNLTVRDVFASRIYENITTNENLFDYSYSLQGRFFTLGLSFGIGKGKAIEFSEQSPF